jgi:hypothetical protein
MSRKPPPPTDKALQGMARYRDAVAKDIRRAIEKAIGHLRKNNAAINVSTVATHAGVHRKAIYKHRDLVAVMDQYRHHPTPADSAATGREKSIVAALRTQLATKDNEIKTLKAKVREHESTIARLYGQIDSRKP